MNDFEIAAWIITTLEGGATSHVAPHDLGGRTHFGVTKIAYADFYGLGTVTDAQIDALTREQAEALWVDLFILRPGFYKISDWRIRLVLAQFAGNAGSVAATKVLQRALKIVVDGVAGSETLWAVAQLDVEGTARLFRRIVAGQLRHYRAIIMARPDQAGNGAGWMRRIAEVMEAA